MARTQKEAELLRFSVSLVTQGAHRFYTLTMPSDVLGRTCFVTTRNEDAKAGFQRVLDNDRAKQIANYIDVGFGTIPSSIVLSAQPDADLRIIGSKTIEFKDTAKAFLVLDGQHRVYGFSLAETVLRVPVVIYNGLSRQDETRLFIDINTKQRPVPNELLLDIKRLAEYETDLEKVLSKIFDKFAEQKGSPLVGLMASASRARGKISRVTFNAALRPIVSVVEESSTDDIYKAIRSYLRAFVSGAEDRDIELVLTNPTNFRAIIALFPDVARKAKDRYASEYTEENFVEVMVPMFGAIRANVFKNSGSSYKSLYEDLFRALQSGFKL